ncbi:hypothetical protein ACEPAG_6889 [Sanghuangporus baumii]
MELGAPGGTLIVVSRVEVDKDSDKYKEKTVSNTTFSSVHIPEFRELDPNRIAVLPNGLAGILDDLDSLNQRKEACRSFVGDSDDDLFEFDSSTVETSRVSLVLVYENRG